MLRSRLTMVFDFQVLQIRSKLTIGTDDHGQRRSATPGYRGELFVDADTHAVTRLKIVAEGLPLDFPIRAAEEILDYDYTQVGDRKYLLPLKGELQLDDHEFLTKNSLEFKHYQKYDVGSAISFDLPKDIGEVPKEKLTETPVGRPEIDCKDPKNKDAKECKGK